MTGRKNGESSRQVVLQHEGEEEEYSDDGYEDNDSDDGFFESDDDLEDIIPADDTDEDPNYSGSEERSEIGKMGELEDDQFPISDEEEEEELNNTDIFNNEMDEFHSDLKAAHGFKKAKSSTGNRGGGRRPLGSDDNLSFEVKALMGEANHMFASGDLDKTMTLVKRVIQIDAGVYSAWKILGEIFNERGDEHKCLLAWLTAAHVRPMDWELWLMCAKMSLEQYGPDKQSYRDQAIYCYSRAIAIKGDNIDAIFDRSLLLKETGQLGKAAEGFVMLNRLLPHDMTVLKELAMLYIDLGRVPEAIQYYTNSVEYFKISGNPDMAFGWSELNILVELHFIDKQWAKAIQTIKSLSRWLYGRSQEKYWDKVTADDREWDTDDRPRKCQVKDFKAGEYHKETYTLPLELRVKLGLCRLKLGEEKEALMHFEHLKHVSPMTYGDLFQEVGDGLYEAMKYQEAIDYYSVVVECAEFLDRKLWFDMAECYKALDGHIEDAEDCYTTILDSFPNDLEAMMQLAGIYEVSDRKAAALDLVNEIIRLRREREAVEKAIKDAPSNNVDVPAEDDPMAFFPNQPIRERVKRRRPGALTTEEKAEMEAKKTEQTAVKYRKLEYLKDAMKAGEPTAVKDWLDTAGELVDDFRNTKAFYPNERNMVFKGFMTTAQRRLQAQGENSRIEKMQHRLQESLTFQDDEIENFEDLQTFRGLNFEVWLEIFLQYAICLGKHDNFQDAYDVCNAAKEANVFFHNKKRKFIIWITWLSIAIYVGDSESCSTICRWFMTTFQFQSEAYSLFIASMTMSKNGLEVFHNNANQKYLLRQIKAMDQSITGISRVGAANLTNVDDEGNAYKPKDIDVGLLMLYGHILASGRSYISALNYYTRAYAVMPHHPIIKFCIGLAYIHRSMQRQSENRHMQVLQGMSFLFDYYDDRTNYLKSKDQKQIESGTTAENNTQRQQEDDVEMTDAPPSLANEDSAVAINDTTTSAEYQEKAGADKQPQPREEPLPFEVQEAEYNIGRAYHHLGLTHLAIPFYERVLQISDANNGKLPGDLKWESAYNLQMIYVTSGNVAMAKRVTDQYLVL
ncbi:transcription factor TFIIIC subunit tfc4 [Rhizina undulata]